MIISQVINSIPEEERTPHILQLIEIIQLQSEQIQALNDEIARLKGEKPKPQIKPSNLGKPKKESDQEWYDHLTTIGIVSPRHVQIATEGALVGSVVEHGVSPDLSRCYLFDV